MTFISYAQNFEDVLLNRVFKHKIKGFYIDVGALYETCDSVTKAFYDRGWSGINIEPIKECHNVFQKERPRDINLNIALSNAEGNLEFFEVMGQPGNSTLNKEIAYEIAKEKGLNISQYTVPVKTLETVCKEYVNQEIDFLKIDVEGLEEQVILGGNWDVFRPTVLIIETTLPNTNIRCENNIPMVLKNKGYNHVFFDGINDYYISKESDDLKKYFSFPVNTLDDYIDYRLIKKQKSELIRQADNQNNIGTQFERLTTINSETTSTIYESLDKQNYLSVLNKKGEIEIALDIAVLGLGIIFETAKTGVYRVTEYLLKGLIKSPRCCVYLCTSIPDVFDACQTYINQNLEYKNLPLFHSSELKYQNIDIYHSTYYPLPNNIYFATRIVTVCDLIPIIFPEYFNHSSEHIVKNTIDQIDKNDFVCSISESTKQDICKYQQNIDAKQVFITHLAADKEKFYPCNDQELIINTKQKYKIPNQPYVLSLSTLEPRKNIAHIIRSFLTLIENKSINDLNLVLIGTTGWQYEEIFAEIDKAQELKNRIIITGYLPDEDLAPLYSGALAFVYLSLYEGFGLPPLEAMQCGTPVITSNTSSLPEVVEDAGIMLAPNDAILLCDAIFKLYSEPEYRENLAKKSVQQSQKFSWDKYVQETIKIYELAKEKAKTLPPRNILIDAVFFQLYQTGIARVWRSLLQEWTNTGFANHILVLDRANTAPKINGIRYRTIPRYDYNNTDADKQMLQQICNEEEAELFISTYYTTPIETPSVFMAYDMIPEVLGGDLNEPMWREKHHAIKHASAYISISKNTAKDLNKCFPDIPSESITVAHCGVDPLFYPASESEINAFKYKYGVTKPYFLLVGTGSGYKNGILFFQAFAKLASSYGFDIICTGIGGVLTPELRTYTSGSAVHLVQLSDEELALAYSGAVALVYPSKYEGFGMPLLEAMACGCPVITCPNASIPEVTGEAAIYVNDDDVVALANALCEVQKPNIRQALITAGLAQSKNFSWTKMAEIVSSELINTTLLPLNLREINLIIFPDWSQPEDELGLELQEVIQTLATHPNSEKITLLINTGDIDTEDAEIFLSSVVMNLMMEEEIDITEELTISLLIDLNEIQWQALLPCINARVSLEHENQKVIVKKQVEQIPLYSLENLKEVSAEQFFFQLGNSLFSQSKYQEAIIQYQKFRQIQIGNPEFYWSFSECFRQLNLLEQCFAVLQEGIKLYPVNAKLHFTVIVNYQMSGRVQEAITAANIALHNLPNNRTFQLISNLILPSVYDQVEEINAYRQRFKQGLDNLINNIPLNNIEDQQNTLIATSCWTNFYLPYQADNVLILQSQYGNWLHQIMKANYPQWGMPLLMPPLKENQKIRIGYASHYLHSYSGTLWLTGWLRYCDRNNFEIYCYYTGNQADAITEKFQEYSDFFYHIPDNLPAVCEQIIADKLHILVYPEIGMDAPTMQMAGLRLAPVQCAAWGHPVTTGLPTIDYFLSSELMEGQNAQEHYSEKLILLPNIGVSYPKPYIPSVIKTRSDYGLSDDDVIYLCCQAPFKYLPQYDFIVAEIASRVSQAKFVFLRGNVLKPRLQRAFAAVGLNSEDYCVHLNIPERLDYLMINLLSDVYLDTFTWSGGNTSLEAIACNLPIVTCPGEFMRGRHTDSFLKMIGVTDTIASNEQKYIEIAVRLGLDKPWRRSIAERMSQNHDCLFDDKACVTGLESFYKKVCSKHFSAS